LQNSKKVENFIFMFYGNTLVCLAFHFIQVQHLKLTHSKILLKSLIGVLYSIFNFLSVYILFVFNCL